MCWGCMVGVLMVCGVCWCEDLWHCLCSCLWPATCVVRPGRLYTCIHMLTSAAHVTSGVPPHLCPCLPTMWGVVGAPLGTHGRPTQAGREGRGRMRWGLVPPPCHPTPPCTHPPQARHLHGPSSTNVPSHPVPSVMCVCWARSVGMEREQ